MPYWAMDPYWISRLGTQIKLIVKVTMKKQLNQRLKIVNFLNLQ